MVHVGKRRPDRARSGRHERELLLIRHGIAQPAAVGRPDHRRALTAEGRSRLRRSVAGLVALELHCTSALHSPWTRAAQTAELLAPLLASASRSCAALARAPDAALLAELQAALPSRGGRGEGTPRLALVGHQPWLGELLAWLVWDDAGAGAGLEFGKAGAAWLTGALRPGGMRLVALLPPRTLRRLGRH